LLGKTEDVDLLQVERSLSHRTVNLKLVAWTCSDPVSELLDLASRLRGLIPDSDRIGRARWLLRSRACRCRHPGAGEDDGGKQDSEWTLHEVRPT
jgi:hypothetical protein